MANKDDDDTKILSRPRGRHPGPVTPNHSPFAQLIVQGKITNTLLAAQLLQHMSQQNIIGLLKEVGASNQTIADILGTSYATVAVSVAMTPVSVQLMFAFGSVAVASYVLLVADSVAVTAAVVILAVVVGVEDASE